MTKNKPPELDTKDDMEAISSAVAEKVKKYRKANKVSFDELSKRAGISKGLVVDLEKGTANPSIATLCKVSNAMNISVADLINTSNTAAISVNKPTDMPVLWRGEKGGQAVLISGTSGPDILELWRWTMKPGEIFEGHAHTKGTVEILYVETGILTFKLEESETILEEGYSALATTDRPHYYSNTGTDDVVFTMSVMDVVK